MSAAAACAALLQRDIRAVLRSRSQLYSSMLFPLMLLGKALAGVSIGGVQALAVLAVAAAVPSIDLEWQYGAAGAVLAVAGVLLLALLLNGFAPVVAARIRTLQGVHLVMNLVLFPLLFFSGAFFPLEHLP